MLEGAKQEHGPNRFVLLTDFRTHTDSLTHTHTLI